MTVSLVRPSHHIHRSVHSLDCDGPLERYSTLKPYRHEPAEEFWQRHLCELLIVSGYPVTVEVGYDTASSKQATEEGHQRVGLELCHDPECADRRSWQRDVYAERMGY